MNLALPLIALLSQLPPLVDVESPAPTYEQLACRKAGGEAQRAWGDFVTAQKETTAAQLRERAAKEAHEKAQRTEREKCGPPPRPRPG